MKLNKVVRIVDVKHERHNRCGVLISQEGDKCVVRFSPEGGLYKYGSKDAKPQFNTHPEVELTENQLVEEEIK